MLKVAGDSKEGHWQKLFDEYSGSSPIVLNAAMHAALKKRDYEEGLKIYKRVRHMTLPTYTISMKLLGKLGQHDEVERRWRQLVEYDLVDQPAAGGRIDAAADNGDIQAAVRVLDYMKGKGIEAKALHFGSAINACANSKDANRAEVAQGFFDEMLRTGLTPTIVTYATVLRAFKHEPRERLLNLLVDMKDQNVRANAVFAETFLFIFLKKPPEKGCWTAQSVIASDLRKLRLADLQTAKDFIDELKHTNVNLNKSCRLIDEAIQSVLQEAHSVMGQSV